MKNIAILSVPRSGSTWLGQIFNSSPEVLYRFQPNYSYSFPFTLRDSSDSIEINSFHEKLKDCNDSFVNGSLSISGKENIQFPKRDYKALVWKEVHFLFLARTLLQNSDTTVVGLIRSPLSVIASWIKTPKEFNPSWNISEQWKSAYLKNKGLESNYFGYKKWKEVTFLFENLNKEYPKRFYLLNYNDLLLNKIECVKKVFAFCGLTIKKQTVDFINKSSAVHKKDAYSVFKVKEKDNQWAQNLPEFIIKEIMDDPEFIELNKRYNWL